MITEKQLKHSITITAKEFMDTGSDILVGYIHFAVEDGDIKAAADIREAGSELLALLTYALFESGKYDAEKEDAVCR